MASPARSPEHGGGWGLQGLDNTYGRTAPAGIGPGHGPTLPGVSREEREDG